MQNNSVTTIHAKLGLDSYTLIQGISQENVQKLILYASKDREVKTQTSDFTNSDGSPGRFSSLLAYEAWEKKGRSIYSLLNKDNEFSGIIWFSHEPEVFNHTTYDFTFGIRLYGKARGIGLAKPFSQAVHTHFRMSNRYLESENQGIWLRTNRDNVPAIATYKSLGYIQINLDQQAHKITMVLQ
jgi:ribosomal protein S18 acetylase RimI-like enzyme